MKIPQFPKKLKGSFWGLTTFFNPAGYKNKYENYKIFQESLKRQGLKLLMVELSFNNKFEIKDEDADIVIRLKGTKKNLMWQKERMLNIGLKHLPRDCDKIAWLDADIIFKNENWVSETSSLLEKYNVVQPFDYAIRLEREVYDMNDNKIKELRRTIAQNENVKMQSMAKKISNSDKLDLKNQVIYHGHTGFVWAARREIFDKIGFYDTDIASSGNDLRIAFAVYFPEVKPINEIAKQNILYPLPQINKEYYIWAKKAYSKVKRSVYYTPGVILHLWHGNLDRKGYDWRHQIFVKHNVDIKKDIEIDKNGLYSWNDDKSGIMEDVKGYFYFKKEDNFGKRLPIAIYLIARKEYHLLRDKLKFYYIVVRDKSRLILEITEGKIYFFRKWIKDSFYSTLGHLGILLKRLSPSIYSKTRLIKDKIRILQTQKDPHR